MDYERKRIKPVDLLKYFTGYQQLDDLIKDVNSYARENNLKIVQITEPKCERPSMYEVCTWHTIVLFTEKE